MAITLAAILSRVNQITKRSETDIDEIFIEALIEISIRTGALKEESSGTLAADTNTITEPSDMIGIDEFYLDEELLDPISFAGWRAGKISSGYARRGSTIYVLPKSNSSKSYTIYYTKYHASSTTVEFNISFQPAVVRLVTAKLYDLYEITEKRNEQLTLYEIELRKISTEDSAVIISRIPANTRI